MNEGGNFLLSLMTLEISLSVLQKLPHMALAETGCRRCRNCKKYSICKKCSICKEIQEMHRIHKQYLYLCRKNIASMEDVQRNDEELQGKIAGISEKQQSIYRIIAKEKYHCKTPEGFQAFQIKRLEKF